MKWKVIGPALLLAGCFNTAAAQTYPVKPIRMIVTYPAGGGTDITARVIAQKISETLGRNAFVDNRVGGGGIVGADQIAKAAPDGYTFGWATPSPFTIGKTLFPTLPYDPDRDFAPVILVNESATVLVLHPSVPARSLKELIALAKARPGSLNVAINNVASVQHLITEMLNHAAGVKMNNVPYKGGLLAATDVVTGQVELLWSVLPVVLPFIGNNRLRVIAVAGEKRSGHLPNVPTTGESGWPKVTGSGWNAVVAPAGTPRNLIDRMHAEIARSLNAPEVKDRFNALGFEGLGSTPDELGAYMRAETGKWAEVIKTAKIRLDAL